MQKMLTPPTFSLELGNVRDFQSLSLHVQNGSLHLQNACLWVQNGSFYFHN